MTPVCVSPRTPEQPRHYTISCIPGASATLRLLPLASPSTMYSSEHEREVLDANNALRWQVYDVYDGIRRVIDLEEDEKPRNEQVLL